MKKIKLTFITALFVSTASIAGADTPSMEEMWKLIQEQQKTIEQLKSQLTTNEKKVVEQIEVVEQQTQALEVISESIDTNASSAEPKYKYGGYGELHYGNTDSGNSIDFHRFVLFGGYEFNDKTSLFTEFEVEHSLAGDGKPGEVEIEQAYIEHRFNDTTKMTAGLSLVPVGILNETHEPDTFYGVERNNVEKNIVPTTWWEAGLGFSKELTSTFGYDLFVSSGLNVPTSGSKAFLIRSGRQKVAEAIANDGALTARARWNPMTNLQIAASYQHQQDITQGAMDVDASLFEMNAQYQYESFALKALYAQWNLDDKAGLIAAGREKQRGFFVEPSYRFGDSNQYGVFARYSEWDNNAGNDGIDSAIEQKDIGFNYWLNPRVVFKAEYQDQSGAKDDDGIHLGVGYSF